MNKKLFLFIISICMNSAIWAQQDRTIVIWLLDGTQTRIQMDSRPLITFGDGDIVNIMSKGITMDYPSKDILKITYESQIATSIKNISFKQDGEYIIFDKNIQESDIHLYTIDGKSIPHSIGKDNKRSLLQLSSLAKGIYVLKINNKGIKIYKK